MKKLITVIIILLAGVVIALDLSNKGQYRLWKQAENHVKVQRTITDPNGLVIVVWEKSYGLNTATSKRNTALVEYNFFNDMNDVEKIAYVDAKKTVAGIKVVKWNAIVNKFAGTIDTE